MEPSTSPSRIAPVEVRLRLEKAHEELCTALTTLRSNVEITRRGQDREASRLEDVESALSRLEALAKDLREWHDRGDA